MAVKQDYERLGPFSITETIGTSAYHNKLPVFNKVHLVIHVSLLELTADDPYTGQIPTPPRSMVVDREEEYEVKEMMISCTRWRRLEYLAKLRVYTQPDWMSA